MWKLLKTNKKKREFKKIYSLQSGKIVDIEKVGNTYFSKKILGDGIGLIPDKNEIFSPVDGEIILIANTKHVIGLKTDDDIKILIHLGIDTVELKGEGFNVIMEVGDKVKQGDLISTMDIDLIKKKGFNPIIIMIIENMDSIKELKKNIGNVKSKNKVVLKYIRNEK